MASSSSNENELDPDIMEAFLALFDRNNIYVAQDRNGDTAKMHAVFRTVAAAATGPYAGSATAEAEAEATVMTSAAVADASDPVASIAGRYAAGAALPSGLVISEESNEFSGKIDSKDFKPFKDNESIDTTHPVPAKTLKEEIFHHVLSSRLFEIKSIPLGTLLSPTSGTEGLFATQPIPAYTEIFREAPLINGGPPGSDAKPLLDPSPPRNKMLLDD